MRQPPSLQQSSAVDQYLSDPKALLVIVAGGLATLIFYSSYSVYVSYGASLKPNPIVILSGGVCSAIVSPTVTLLLFKTYGFDLLLSLVIGGLAGFFFHLIIGMAGKAILKKLEKIIEALK